MADEKNEREGEKSGKGEDGKKKPRPRPERRVSVTGETFLGGRTIPYTATAGTLNLKDDKGEDRASVFYVEFCRSDAGDAEWRPVTFCFNGGPGSSAVWLQFGAFGPHRLAVPDALASPPPPHWLADNDCGLLDLTDLVFIDPVGTGFSRAAGEAEDKEFHAYKEDIAAVGEFIRRWLSRSGRWNSPRFLAGESYGTTRAAGLAKHLQERGIPCNGLVMVSLALQFQTLVFDPGNDLPHVLYLPTYAATAWYHRKLPERPDSLSSLLAEVRNFAIEEYAPALLLGSRLDPQRRRMLAEQLARYTGLPAAEIERRNLRIHYLWFTRRLLGEGDRTVGRLDGRYVGPDLDPYGVSTSRDPSYDAVLGAYTAAVNDYLRRRIGWESEEDYAVLSEQVHNGWRWSEPDKMGYVDAAADLRAAMLANPHLKVLFANGLYDLATPFFAAEHTAEHLEIPDDLRRNIQLTFYEAGHMMYFHPPSHRQLRADIAAFYSDALGGER